MSLSQTEPLGLGEVFDKTDCLMKLDIFFVFSWDRKENPLYCKVEQKKKLDRKNIVSPLLDRSISLRNRNLLDPLELFYTSPSSPGSAFGNVDHLRMS